jgi:hypothetical protein
MSSKIALGGKKCFQIKQVKKIQGGTQMFQFIPNFFIGSWARVRLTVEQISWTLGLVFILTIIGVLPAFFGTPIAHSFYISFPLWLFSAYRIFGIWRYLHVAIAGEMLDSFQAIGPETNKTIWDSELAATYRKYAINVWLAQTIIFLAAPLYFNLTSGGRLWLPILIMVIFAIAMISIKAGLWIFRTVAVMTISIFLLVAGYDMFPQVGYIPLVSEGVAKLRAGKLAGENARELSKVNALRERQRQAMLTKATEKAAAWQISHPGKALPTEVEQDMIAAKQGLTLDEFKAKLKADEKILAPPVDGGTANPPPMQNQLLSTFPATIQITGGKSYFETREIKTGKYRVVPSDTKVNLGEGWNARGTGEFEITNSRQTIGVLSPSGSSTVTIFQR